jgi:hypothetical protein
VSDIASIILEEVAILPADVIAKQDCRNHDCANRKTRGPIVRNRV